MATDDRSLAQTTGHLMLDFSCPLAGGLTGDQSPQLEVEYGGSPRGPHVGRGSAPLPLLLCHGWPSSFAGVTEVMPRLSDPAAYGSDVADSLTMVVPSLPGYLFSAPWPAGEAETS